MSKFEVEVTGHQAVNELLKTVPAKVGVQLIRTTVTKIAARLDKKATEVAPELTGLLKATIEPKRRRGKPLEVRATVNVSKEAFYWRFLEYGKGPDQVEHAMFLQAINEMKANIGPVYLEEFTKALTKRLASDARKAARAAKAG